jgi:pilus assembly protein CpaC
MRMTRPATTPRMAALAAPILVILVLGGAIHAQQPVLTTVSASAPVPEPSTPDTLRLLVGRSTLVDVGAPISRVSLTSSDVADALVTSPNQLLVHGKVPGAISMFVWSRGGEVRRFEVAVQRDLSRLTDQVHQLFPGEDIQIRGNGLQVLLSGTVASKDLVERAVNLASGFVDKKEDVVTLLQVREGRVSNQVLLRVRFAEVSRSALTQFGMSLFTAPTGIKNTVGRLTTQQYPAPGFEELAWTKATTDYGHAPTSSEGKLNFGDFMNVFLLSQKYDLGTVIKAMQQRGVFQSLAEPNLVAESGTEASFLAGGEFPVPIVQGGSNQSISVSFKEFGVRLNFTPTVNGDRVHLKVRPEVSTLDFANGVVLNGFRIPALSTRRAETQLELRNGQTFAVAGLMNNQVATTLQKVPGIGDIPILGHLFRSRAAQKDQTELVVMITPEILPTESAGVTASLPRTPDTFLPALPEAQTKAPLVPAFTPERRSSVSASASDQVLDRTKARSDHNRIEDESRDAKQAERASKVEEARARAGAMAEARAKIEEARAAEKAAQAEVRRQRDEQKRAEKEARTLEKAQREQEVRDKKAALSEAEAERTEPAQAAEAAAPSEAPAGVQQAAGVEKAVDTAATAESEEERARAQAIAEARQRALEDEAKAAQVDKQSTAPEK